MYTIVVRILDYGYKAAKTMTFTTIAAIIISAIIELFTNLAVHGFNAETFKNFSYYFFSCLGTIVGVWVMVFITIRFREKNISCYIIIPVAIAISSIIHSLFFYGGIALINWEFGENALYRLLGAVIGKTVCIGLSVVCYFINKKYWIPLNLVAKENGNKDN